ncbi:UDP-N-acetylenolpyruvoylglucosamine reductase [Candidatus Jorgensenbacteria bacterium CG_4_10_14_0_8_um_filter_39_13]|uniref:UDP-N-acetylenolpyruvoylglucosamine reductase n=2 Tax=Candidatus Joergenseniibacteriota TaxID=1752739 RepID=A0A2M7RI14_9BACT|nr:MAG: UDP-N-acetylenolpyruvoylglucosamine reductase [Candidatus Jorgensenbacteria bacterium CG11_big_fil_rev_8_21_14_0_20_38_23]PIV12955.1 MAG: UDP-N-acetylenolpyruvoylglucosamine reductase [Candidatus Jorgensenbacteria bacterium CG03_land_8_20_14_0_80_38_39]PIW97766.1 MAG: UDP-N-acetylenolpyruvoylglucosamine reductase [Candidatus Jorgensenbacteria bacterium CG_4_8_14_3_um_filter_38_10]PIY96207.1 MAG: UDP-N-acetylenolpyruvoylglucosamine reductase [Candidatus Jorgensenbacteria bacterium CG_4_10
MIQLEKDVLLKRHSHYQIGGPAKYFFQLTGSDNLEEVYEKIKILALPVFILAGGTNILFPDKGWEGLVIKVANNFIKKENDFWRIGAGTTMADILDYAVSDGFSGLEWAGGLPGTLGGAIFGNAGAFGGEIKNSVIETVSWDFSQRAPNFIQRKKDDCQFSYRSSIFKTKPQEIILEVKLKFEKGEAKKIKKSIQEKINYRKKYQPLEYPNAGSIFKNIDLRKIPKNLLAFVKPAIKMDPQAVVPAAFLLDQAGLKGETIGGAMISPKHPNFFVNLGEAKAADVLGLIELAKEKIKKQFQLALEEEIIIIK